MRPLVLALSLVVAALGTMAARPATAPQASSGPLLTVETVKGTFQIRLFQADAPKSVAHILELVQRNFYRGLRVHRVENSLVQFGDPTTRNMTLKDGWGRTGSGHPIGVAELNANKHVRGAVSLAHAGDPRYGDSQMFIMKTASPSLDGKHVVIGRVTSGMNVVDRLRVADIIKQISLTTAAR